MGTHAVHAATQLTSNDQLHQQQQSSSTHSQPLLQWVVEMNVTPEEARYTAEKHGLIYDGMFSEGIYIFKGRRRSQRSISNRWFEERIRELKNESMVTNIEQQVARLRVKRSISPLTFDDPLWPKMWYLNDGLKVKLSMNVMKVWQRGYTGKGITVVVLDDGIEFKHPDLIDNYDKTVSTDLNGEDNSPEPRYVPGNNDNRNHHGTRCAGTIAAVANNSVCGLGVAYNARIGGIRMLDGEVTDLIEAKALSYARNFTDIYSSSWGPDDNGKRMEGPSRYAQHAFEEGVRKGRNGRGSIFVWASGNGGHKEDDCNADGYTNSIFTISISSVSENGRAPWYSEMCSSTLAAAFSSNTKEDRAVITTDINEQCIDNHSGTSASAPLATGVCALTLSANNNLTWRDMQHIIVRTARSDMLLASDWVSNGARRRFSHAFGFGLLDADAMVTHALSWVTVPDQHICEEYWQDKSDVGAEDTFHFVTPAAANRANHSGAEVQNPPSLHRPYHPQYSRDTWNNYDGAEDSVDNNDEEMEAQDSQRAERYYSHKFQIEHNLQMGNFYQRKSRQSHTERSFNAEIKPNKVRTFSLVSDGCQQRDVLYRMRHRTSDGSSQPVRYLEHVQAKLLIMTKFRGQVQIWLISPSGTVSQLLHRRKYDNADSGINWTFMSVHFWGENPAGTWKLRISGGEYSATLVKWTLVLYGTDKPPYSERRAPRDPKAFVSMSSSSFSSSLFHRTHLHTFAIAITTLLSVLVSLF